MIIVNYFMVGVLVGFLMELSVNKITKESFTFGGRLFVISFWPLSLTVFIIGMFRK